MYKVIDNKDAVIKSINVGWENSTVRVPRCARCKSVHTRTENHVQRGWQLGLLVGIPLSLLAFFYLASRLIIIPVVAFGVAIIGGLFGWALSRAFSPKEVKDQGHATKHPNIERMEAEGWKIGSKPIADKPRN